MGTRSTWDRGKKFAEWASSDYDAQAASFLQAFYELAAHAIEGAGGRIVKFMGDAGLVVFPKESMEEMIGAFRTFARAGRRVRSAST